MLRAAGFNTQVATTLEGAFALLRAPGARFAAIVTDHLLGDGSGMDFVRELRRSHAHMPVIVVTGSAEAESEYEGLNVIFREKPFPPEELIALVRSVTSRAA